MDMLRGTHTVILVLHDSVSLNYFLAFLALPQLDLACWTAVACAFVAFEDRANHAQGKVTECR